MLLDSVSLKLALGVVMLTLCWLFWGSFRRTQSPYSGWWCVALALWLAGNASFLLTGTPLQVWANPLGNALLVAGAFSVWAGTRSLRLLPTRRWHLLAGPGVTSVASLLENPAVNAWSGGLVYLAMMGTGMAFAARELSLLKPNASQAHRPLLVAAAALVAYFFARGVVFFLLGPEGQAFRTYFSPAVTCVFLIMLLITVSFSMTELSNEQLINALKERATRDGMTGLLNREAFTELAEQQCNRLHAAGSVSTVILADLDHFKAVNDTHGHAAGDAAIQAFAAACLASVRRTDLVGRYGGEEFIILLPGADQDRAAAITADISRRLASSYQPEGITFPTASYGIASTNTGADLTQMIATADAALYKAKALGRNRAVSATKES